MLYIVATPIGNLEDMTFRAVETLKSVDYIAAEDTRHSKILLDKYEIKTPTISFHAWSDERKLEQLLQMLSDGKNVALISDAGTPGISDPGYLLVREAAARGIKVIPVPGASAVISALCASGLPTNQFVYLGFLPLKKGRKTLLESLKEEARTIVFYESPHRLLKTLGELDQYFGERPIALARELTKFHEEYFRGTAKEAHEHFTKKGVKGEFVIMISAVNKGKHHHETEDFVAG
jgi:16S rRNA (cytidine1402-2'-O)-methyltransferase